MLTLLRFVDAYLSHFLQHPQSFVCRVYGCYELMVCRLLFSTLALVCYSRCVQINGLSSSMCVLLMGNVHQVPKCWCTCAADWAEHSEVYDLKGEQ